MKRKISALLCAFMLLLCSGTGVMAAGSSDAASQQSSEAGEEPSKAVKIAGFLVIFTASMGVTAYIIVRPKLKQLKEARGKMKKDE